MIVRLSGAEVHVIMFYSALVALIIQGIILSRRKYRSEIPHIRKIWYFLIPGILSLINTFTYFYAFKHTTIANAVLTHYIAPVIVAFLAASFLNEKITREIVIAIVIASGGLWIMLNGFSLTEGHTAGIIAGIISGFAYAVIVVISRIYVQKFSPLALAFFSNAVIVMVLAFFVRELPLNTLWIFLIMGIVHSTIAPLLYFKGLMDVTANRTAVLGYLEPVCAIVFSMLFLNEVAGMNSIIGGILIIFAGYLTLKSD